MSIRCEFKKCRKCGRRFNFNPDVGQFKCPYCHDFPDKSNDLKKRIFNRINLFFKD